MSPTTHRHLKKKKKNENKLFLARRYMPESFETTTLISDNRFINFSRLIFLNEIKWRLQYFSLNYSVEKL